MISKNYLKIYLLTLLSFLVGTSQFIIAGVLDKISLSLDITIASAGQLVSVYALASAIFTPFLSVLLSKQSLKKQLLIALCLFLIGIFITPLDYGFEVLIIARALTGVGASLFVAVSYVLATRLAPEGKQGSAMSNIALGFSLSLVLGVPLGRIIANVYDWQSIFYIIGILVAFGLVFIILSIENQKPKLIPTFKEQFSILKNVKVLLSLSITVFVFITFSSITTFITPLLFAIEKVSEHDIATIFLILGIASVIGSKSGASLADKVGISKILIYTLCAIIFSFVIMSLFSTSLYIVVAMLSLWTLAMWMFGPTQSLNLARIVPSSASILLSLNSSFVQLGFAIGAGFGGFVVSSLSIKDLLWVGVFPVGIALVLYLYISKRL